MSSSRVGERKRFFTAFDGGLGREGNPALAGDFFGLLRASVRSTTSLHSMRFASLLVFCLVAATGWSVDFAQAIPGDCRAVALVTGRDWSSPVGTLRRFERPDNRSPWRAVGTPMNTLLGEHGMAWGLGLHASPNDGAPHKAEGDRRSPAGVFALGTAFGRVSREDVKWLRMPYQLLSPTTEAIDDPASRFYNRLVDRAQIAEPDWRSSEHMWKVPDYELGVIIASNPKHITGAGSCIFLHLWIGNRDGTAGCTALHRADLVELLRWLDSAKRPVLVQLPEQVTRTSLTGF